MRLPDHGLRFGRRGPALLCVPRLQGAADVAIKHEDRLADRGGLPLQPAEFGGALQARLRLGLDSLADLRFHPAPLHAADGRS